MNTTKQQFQKNKALLDWWMSVVSDDRFQQMEIYARAAVMEGRPTYDAMIGADAMLKTMTNLVESDETSNVWPTSGLDHGFDTKIKPQPESKP